MEKLHTDWSTRQAQFLACTHQSTPQPKPAAVYSLFFIHLSLSESTLNLSFLHAPLSISGSAVLAVYALQYTLECSVALGLGTGNALIFCHPKYIHFVDSHCQKIAQESGKYL